MSAFQCELFVVEGRQQPKSSIYTKVVGYHL